MIKFYKLRDPYGCFSNFSKHPITVNNKVYATTEHYFQAMKFLTEELQENVRVQETPRKARNVGVSTKGLRPDWESVKYGIMVETLRYKVSQNEDVKKSLLETGEEELVENTTDDYTWGCGTNGDGKNLLGKAWMEVRSELQRGESLKT